MMDHMHSGFQMPMAAPPLMNPPPQIFGGYPEHGMQMHQLPPDLSVAQMFGDHGLLDDSNEAKRRRIARVSLLAGDGLVDKREKPGSLMRFVPPYRLVICAGRRKSSAMVNCLPARTASTTKQTASSHRWKRRGIHRKGACYPICRLRSYLSVSSQGQIH